MSVDRFKKHQKSKYGKYVLIDSDGNVIFNGSNEKEFRAKQDELSKPARDRKAKEAILANHEE